MRAPLLFGPLLAMLAASPAWADSHGVTIQNASSETIRLVQISPTAGSGENRLRSQLPPGASGRITYSTGCQANVRIGYESGRTEDHGNIDVCSEPRVVAGTDGVAGPMVAPTAPGTPARPGTATVNPLKSVASKVALAPPPVVPPWTGKSITKRFGGME